MVKENLLGSILQNALHNLCFIWRVEMNNIKVFVIEPGGDITSIMLKDLENMENVTVIPRPYTINNSVLRFLKKLHYHQKTNRVFEIPCKALWNGFSELHKLPFDFSDNNIILFNSFALQEYDISVLKKFFSLHSNVKKAVYFSDTINSSVIRKAVDIVNAISFDFIYTFDPNDAEKYGYKYINSLYSKIAGLESHGIKEDLYFVGENKGRLHELHKIYNLAKKNGVSTSFRILRVNQSDMISNDIVYNCRIKYLDMLREVQDTNCILDVVQQGQTGTTLRYYEAVCYNKKLLTNNKSLYNLKYYNPNYIQIFDNTDSIDWEWIRQPAKVDYHYTGEYSPKRFIHQIISDCQTI